MRAALSIFLLALLPACAESAGEGCPPGENLKRWQLWPLGTTATFSQCDTVAEVVSPPNVSAGFTIGHPIPRDTPIVLEAYFEVLSGKGRVRLGLETGIQGSVDERRESGLLKVSIPRNPERTDDPNDPPSGTGNFGLYARGWSDEDGELRWRVSRVLVMP